jgi:hypothetical protein
MFRLFRVDIELYQHVRLLANQRSEFTNAILYINVLSWTVCASVGSANNMNKLSLVGMQLAKKIKVEFRRFERRPFGWSY